MGAAVALMLALRGLVLSRPAKLDQPLPPNAQFYPVIAGRVRQHGAAHGLEIFMQSAEYREIASISPDAARCVGSSPTRAPQRLW